MQVSVLHRMCARVCVFGWHDPLLQVLGIEFGHWCKRIATREEELKDTFRGLEVRTPVTRLGGNTPLQGYLSARVQGSSLAYLRHTPCKLPLPGAGRGAAGS